jgi:hypothetical protein
MVIDRVKARRVGFMKERPSLLMNVLVEFLLLLPVVTL